MGAILLIIILGIVVVVHELGHFLFAKKFGIRVDEFGVGFPPRAKTLFTKGETKYTLNWIPFGGFVKIFGENPEDAKPDSPDYARSMPSKAKWKQAIVLFGGVLFNFLLAWLLISVGFMSGLPSSIDPSFPSSSVTNSHVTVTNVAVGMPASLANLKPGDKILAIDGNEENAGNVVAVQSYIQSHGGEEILLKISRGNTETNIAVTPKTELGSNKAIIGIGLDLVGIVKLNFFHSIWQGLRSAYAMTVNIIVYFGHFIAGFFNGAGSSIESISGPVGIAGIAGDAAKLGFSYLISLTAIISINLFVLNLIPFPALDGGRLLFLGIEAVTRRKLNQKFFVWTNVVGFALLILLMVVVTYHDVVKLF